MLLISRILKIGWKLTLIFDVQIDAFSTFEVLMFFVIRTLILTSAIEILK